MSLTPEPAPTPLPEELARERGALLHRALRDLPLSLLEAMLRGLRRHADALAPGGLYTDDGSGGCAVGMMLREIAEEPSADRRPTGRWARRFRFRSPTVREERPDLARANPRLWHLELMFDVTCNEMADRLGLVAPDVARSVGLWMAAETQAEISLRLIETAAQDQARRARFAPRSSTTGCSATRSAACASSVRGSPRGRPVAWSKAGSARAGPRRPPSMCPTAGPPRSDASASASRGPPPAARQQHRRSGLPRGPLGLTTCA